MARMMRADWQGAVHHVMARGIDGRYVFSSEQDKEDLLSRLALLVTELEFSVYAWAIMPNHLHLLVRTGKEPLWKLMHRLLTGYGLVYNRNYERRGHVFQSRFRSILVQEELYFVRLLRYIHRNPLEAGLVHGPESLAQYRWCGHGAILGKHMNIWQDTSYVIAYFGDKYGSDGISEYLKAVIEDCDDKFTNILVEGSFIIGRDGITPAVNDYREWTGCCRVLGDECFALDSLKRIRSSGADGIRDRSDVHQGIESLLIWVRKEYGITRQMLQGMSRNPSLCEARAVVSWVCTQRMGLSIADCMRLLGMSRSGVRKAIARAESLQRKNPRINDIPFS
ncbi:MAG: hypothetical protein AVO35_08105 [Candidatus Aegiribacteria sp. MLS_C]|nr:MAG: hypothetical protein AVO35_08105 [Candidatus Aegiribacteria sp. MLS_C]